MADLPISKVEVGLSMDWGVKGLDYVYKSSYNEKKVRPCDLQTLMIDVSLHRAKRVEGEIEPLATRISNRNDTLDNLGTALADLTSLQAKFDSEADGDDREGALDPDSYQILQDVFGAAVKFTNLRMTKYEVEEWLQRVKSKIDSLNNQSEKDMSRLQSLVDRRDEAFTTSNHQTIKLSNYQTIKLSNHQTIMAISVETIAVNRYAPRGSEAVNLYSNGLEGGDHLTIGQLVIAVAMRSAAAYEAQSVTKMNSMAAGTAVLDRAADYMDKVANGTNEWPTIRQFLIDELGVDQNDLPADIDTYKKRMEAINAMKVKVDALTQNQQTDMIDMQSLVNRRDTAYSASSNMVRALGKSMHTDANNF